MNGWISAGGAIFRVDGWRYIAVILFFVVGVWSRFVGWIF